MPASPSPPAADVPAEKEQLKPSSKQTAAAKKTVTKSKPESVRRLTTRVNQLFQISVNFYSENIY